MKTSTAMKKLSMTAAGTALVTLGMLATGTAARANQLITNGDFETGDFTGWTVTNQAGGSGSFFVTNPPVTPLSGIATVGPAGGSFYAVSDQTGPGTHALWQTFTVPGPAQSVILKYDMFVNDSDGGPIINPAGLDYTAFPNQQARVDILVAGASPLSTSPADILGNFYLGVDPQFLNPNPYTSYSFDITSLVGAGGNYILRFAEVDNQLFLNQGVDNVGVHFIPAATPEPTSVLGLLAIGALGAGSALKRKLK